MILIFLLLLIVIISLIIIYGKFGSFEHFEFNNLNGGKCILYINQKDVPTGTSLYNINSIPSSEIDTENINHDFDLSNKIYLGIIRSIIVGKKTESNMGETHVWFPYININAFLSSFNPKVLTEKTTPFYNKSIIYIAYVQNKINKYEKSVYIKTLSDEINKLTKTLTSIKGTDITDMENKLNNMNNILTTNNFVSKSDFDKLNIDLNKITTAVNNLINSGTGTSTINTNQPPSNQSSIVTNTTIDPNQPPPNQNNTGTGTTNTTPTSNQSGTVTNTTTSTSSQSGTVTNTINTNQPPPTQSSTGSINNSNDDEKDKNNTIDQVKFNLNIFFKDFLNEDTTKYNTFTDINTDTISQNTINMPLLNNSLSGYTNLFTLCNQINLNNNNNNKINYNELHKMLDINDTIIKNYNNSNSNNKLPDLLNRAYIDNNIKRDLSTNGTLDMNKVNSQLYAYPVNNLYLPFTRIIGDGEFGEMLTFYIDPEKYTDFFKKFVPRYPLYCDIDSNSHIFRDLNRLNISYVNIDTKIVSIIDKIAHYEEEKLKRILKKILFKMKYNNIYEDIKKNVENLAKNIISEKDIDVKRSQLKNWYNQHVFTNYDPLMKNTISILDYNIKTGTPDNWITQINRNTARVNNQIYKWFY